MVVAHLRGLLKPTHRYGRRSRISEDIMLEGLASDMMAKSLEDAIRLGQAYIPVLSEKGIKSSGERMAAQLQRVAELRAFDLFKVADQLFGHMKVANGKKEMSLYQLYQIAEKHGIFDAFADQAKKATYKPLI